MAGEPPRRERRRALNVLILGGTRFLGRALTESLLERGHAVTLFHRGQSLPDGLPGAASIIGDRTADLAAIDGRAWDSVIDTSGTIPWHVEKTVAALVDRTARYWYVSSISVYRDDAAAPIDESSPVVEVPDALPAEVTPEAYGAQKVASERAVMNAFGERATIVRPGLIVGPYDRSDRFTYWVRRVAAGGTILAPAEPERRVQFIDVRDLADWMVRGVEAWIAGTYNATGPALAMGEVLATCAGVAGVESNFVWIPDDWLLREGVGPWMELPLWLPAGEDALISSVDCSRAIAQGLHSRPLAETVRATLDWDRTRPAGAPMQAGLDGERERRLLDTWNGRKG